MTTVQTPPETRTTTERYHFTSDDAIAQIKRLVHEGNVRRVTIKNSEGHTIIDFPLTVGVVGAALVPVWAAIGAAVALMTECSIEVERAEEPSEEQRPKDKLER
ncbi:MAG TPA: DUF4342 domain-containing protein [Ktedonobacterales bacterium]